MPLFEAAFLRRLGALERDAVIDVLDAFEFAARLNPRSLGEPHPNNKEFWTYEPPRTIARVPRMVLVYSIDDDNGVVRLWNIYLL